MIRFHDTKHGVTQFGVVFPDSSVQWCDVEGNAQYLHFSGAKYDLASRSGREKFEDRYRSLVSVVRVVHTLPTQQPVPKYIVREVKAVVVEGMTRYLKQDDLGNLVADDASDPPF